MVGNLVGHSIWSSEAKVLQGWHQKKTTETSWGFWGGGRGEAGQSPVRGLGENLQRLLVLRQAGGRRQVLQLIPELLELAGIFLAIGG